VERFPSKALWLDENMGAVRATNAGLMLSMLNPSEFVLVLDDDTEIPKGDVEWLDRWLKHFDDPKVGAAGATTDYVAGAQNIEVCPETYDKAWKDEKTGAQGMEGPVFAPFLISFACMYRKSALKKMYAPSIGHEGIALAEKSEAPLARSFLWDERFEPGNSEDIDVSVRLRLAGYQLKIARDVYIHHKGSQTFKGVEGGFDALLEANRQKMVEKWGIEILSKLHLAAPQEAGA